MAGKIDVSTLGGRIKNKRIAAGMTQESLAELMYVKNTLISQYESNAIMPPIDKLREIAMHLKTSISYLVEGVESYVSDEDREILEAIHSIKNDVMRNALMTYIKQVANA